MTEEEWLASDNPNPMAEAALKSARASDRTCRLFVAAFWGWQALRLSQDQQPSLLRRVAVMEHWAEMGRLPKGTHASRSKSAIFFNRNAAGTLTGTVDAPNALWKTGWQEALCIQPFFLRDIFGNPFRPVVCEPEWLTSDVLLLARGIYDERAFDRMPILADALQDAGCTNDDVLHHCRNTFTHVRGCWVVDLLLGKT